MTDQASRTLPRRVVTIDLNSPAVVDQVAATLIRLELVKSPPRAGKLADSILADLRRLVAPPLEHDHPRIERLDLWIEQLIEALHDPASVLAGDTVGTIRCPECRRQVAQRLGLES